MSNEVRANGKGLHYDDVWDWRRKMEAETGCWTLEEELLSMNIQPDKVGRILAYRKRMIAKWHEQGVIIIVI